MIRLWLIFGIIWAVFFFGITAFRNMSGKDKWALTKTLAYSTLCSLLALATMVVIVVLF
jgi:hypothetical protein